MSRNYPGNGRAHICYEPKLRTHTTGKRPAYMNPGFEVRRQNEPTDAHPVSQHKQFKGHSTAHSAGRIPK